MHSKSKFSVLRHKFAKLYVGAMRVQPTLKLGRFHLPRKERFHMFDSVNAWFQWYHVIFWAAFLVMGVYALLMFGGLISGGGELDGGHHDVDGGGHSHDGEVHGGSDHVGVSSAFRGFLGIGKVPMVVILMTALGLWGISGLVLNNFLKAQLEQSPNWGWISMAGALVITFLGTGGVARVVGKIMPSHESYASAPTEFIGKNAQVTYTVDERNGQVMVVNQYGTMLNLGARAKPGTGPFRPGDSVQVLKILGPNTYLVGPLETAASS